jgi:hypothetical protein
MTKSRNIGRGGARPGAGRKAKPVAGPTAIGSIIPPGLDDDGQRKFCETLALETLATIAATGTSESARVAASRELLDRTRGKPSPATKPADADQGEASDHWDGLLGSKPASAAKATN